MIGRPGGTGKSQIFEATGITEFFSSLGHRHQLKITAPTGVAATNIGGATIYSEASLLVSKCIMESNIGKAREKLEERWQNTDFLIVDEISFLRCGKMSRLSEYLAFATCHEPETSPVFGGLSVTFAGDMAQLPPLQATVLFNREISNLYNPDGSTSALNGSNEKNKEELLGMTVWRQVNNCVVLKQVMRQKEEQFIQLLGRLRYGICTKEDKALLDRYVLLSANSSADNSLTHVSN
jgi:hypothetical protein